MTGGVARMFNLVSERSAVVIEAHSNLGPILFAGTGLTGEIEAPEALGQVDLQRASAQLEVRVDQLASGNSLYDSELRRRVDARRYPRSTVRLRGVEPPLACDRFHVVGDVTFHGVTRTLSGEVQVALDDDHIVVTGEQLLDIRNFDMMPFTMLMLKIEPEILVRLHVEAMLTA